MRKPIWYPTAPSKLYDIPEPVYYAPDEWEQFDALERKYQDGLRSLQNYLHKNVYMASITTGGFDSEQVKAEYDEQVRLLKENEEENERVRVLREKMTKEFKEEIERKAVEREYERLVDLEEFKKIAEKEIRKEIERSKTYITRDRLEEAIEYALDNPVSYEFAIDLNGKIVGATHPYALRPSAVPDSSGLPLIEPQTSES